MRDLFDDYPIRCPSDIVSHLTNNPVDLYRKARPIHHTAVQIIYVHCFRQRDVICVQ